MSVPLQRLTSRLFLRHSATEPISIYPANYKLHLLRTVLLFEFLDDGDQIRDVLLAHRVVEGGAEAAHHAVTGDAHHFALGAVCEECVLDSLEKEKEKTFVRESKHNINSINTTNNTLMQQRPRLPCPWR